MRRIALLSLALALAACQNATPPAPASAPVKDTYDASASSDARRIEADVRFLADDLLEGREAGTRGYDLASLYVAQRFRAIGLAPAGDDGSYFQRVPMLRGVLQADGNAFAIARGGGEQALKFPDDFLPGINFNEAQASVDAPAVFVGQGVHAPELGHDDFAGVDVKGKIAVMFNGAPAKFDNDRRAFYSSRRTKAEELVRRGAVGVVVVMTDDEARQWPRLSANWNRPGMRLRGEDGKGIDTWPELRGSAIVSADKADAVLATGTHTAKQLFQELRDGKLRAFDLPGTLRLASHTQITPVDSRNVVARLAGGDPKRSGEHVVFSAHLDHVGIGAPVKGDAIYNGALDNAMGIAVMLEAANRLAHENGPTKRSLLFVAVTAEEKGLLGAEWFARHPTVPAASMVANVNMDMPMLLAPTSDVVPIGLEHSTLQPLVQQAAKEIGVSLSKDPSPEEVVFVRSDQYAFIRAGVPAVYLDGGYTGVNGDAKAVQEAFLAERYHQPGDDLSQPIHWPDAARLAKLNARIGRLIADSPQRPQWNAGDFFGEKFGRKEAAR
ncbi:M20/M25/M40 family metallo-hydrolase [Lysobacter auxotrophicus]|uniref:M28 family metallopeptidase n=1 Tax=Lysobacter auxotrophicus TaxID=2992573 RepID=A0ABM8D8H7_9GAMM|nr:M20/M25/M40 family metallo-hydrolase [Lysobacter auxotrophicus]BDU14842.1 M28 family metallopeptidase [Lysobacter auxotrophicus]